MKTKEVNVTPTMARGWMEKNTKNRPSNAKHTSWLASQMTAGKWKLNPQPIIFNGDGTLLDGQHRLMAVIESGKTVKMNIVTGAASDVFDVLDTNRTRTAGDVLAIQGYANAKVLAGAIQFLLNFNSGNHTYGGRSRISTSNAIIADYVQKRPELCEWAAEGLEFHKNFRLLGQKAAVGMYCILKNKHPRLVKEFYEKVFFGENLERDEPANLFRVKMINDQLSYKKLKSTTKLAIFIKAWNAFKEGTKVTHLRYLDTENFPVLK